MHLYKWVSPDRFEPGPPPSLVDEATQETCQHRAAALHVGTACCDGDQTCQAVRTQERAYPRIPCYGCTMVGGWYATPLKNI